MTSLLSKEIKTESESGFTLVELLVVILIIGVLAAITIPAFMNQREKAALGQVQTDVKNAATVMEDSYIDSQSYPANIPNYNKVSEASQVYTNITSSGPQNFCLEGTHNTYPNIHVVYDSLKGGLVDDERCSEPVAGEDGGSWAAGGGGTYEQALSETKALVIYNNRGASSLHSTLVGYLNEAGVTDIDFNANASSVADFEGYDLIIAAGFAWSIPFAVADLLEEAQAAGYDILTDGNDSGEEHLHFVDVSTRSISHGSVSPTGNQVRPSFPYIFSTTSWTAATESWQCITKVGSSATVVGAHTLDDGTKCGTMVADVSNGQWLHISRFETGGKALQAGILWLLQ